MRKLPHNAPDGFDWVVRSSHWQLEKNVLSVTAETNSGEHAQLNISAISPEIWRVTFIPQGCTLLKTPIIQAPLDMPTPLAIEENEQGILVKGPRLSLQIDRDP